MEFRNLQEKLENNQVTTLDHHYKGQLNSKGLFVLFQFSQIKNNKPERGFGLQVRCRELDIFKIRNSEKSFEISFWIFFEDFFWRNFFEGNFLGSDEAEANTNPTNSGPSTSDNQVNTLIIKKTSWTFLDFIQLLLIFVA